MSQFRHVRKGIQGNPWQLSEGIQGARQGAQTNNQVTSNQPRVVPPRGGSGTARPQGNNQTPKG